MSTSVESRGRRGRRGAPFRSAALVAALTVATVLAGAPAADASADAANGTSVITIGFLSQPNYAICREILSLTQIAVSLINAKDDGFMDDLLPAHTLRLLSSNSRCTRDGGVLAGLEQVDRCGASEYGSVVASIGTACSDSSTGAQDIFKNAMVPMVSYAATSPALSDTNKYPLFARTVPSDTSQAPSLLALLEHYGISRLGVLSFDDAYTKGVADAFRSASAGSLTVDIPGAASAVLLATTKATVAGAPAHLTDLSLTCKVRFPARSLRSTPPCARRLLASRVRPAPDSCAIWTPRASATSSRW